MPKKTKKTGEGHTCGECARFYLRQVFVGCKDRGKSEECSVDLPVWVRSGDLSFGPTANDEASGCPYFRLRASPTPRVVVIRKAANTPLVACPNYRPIT